MRAILLGLAAGILVVCGLNAAPSTFPEVHAQRIGGSDPAGAQRADLVAIAGSVVDRQQLLLVMDPHRRTLASYQVDAQTGQIALRSVRDLRWDLAMDYFNGTEPSPEKIQALLE
jgi:hypothetical protein